MTKLTKTTRGAARGLAPALGLLGLVALAGCRTTHAPIFGPRDSERGIASWYGEPFDGRRTASGEVYDMEALTAAHRTLPFGTYVLVRNLSNDQTVRVRINDRGPFARGRVIDLSRGAARCIDLIRPGTAEVQLAVIAADPDVAASGPFTVQVGAFVERDNAERLAVRLSNQFPDTHTAQQNGLWLVQVGRLASRGDAESLAGRLAAEGLPSFVRPPD